MSPFVAPTQLLKLTIEITTLCNLKCAGCPRTLGVANGTWSNTHMDLDRFERILAGLPVTGMVTLHGIGEPTLHPRFVELVEMAKASGKFRYMKVTTNGLARSVEYYTDAVRAGLDEIWISVDSFDPEIAERMRSGTPAGKLRTRVAQCVAAGVPTRISTVVSAVNYMDLPDTLRELHRCGVKRVSMQEYQDYGDPYGLMTPAMREEFLREMRSLLPTLSGMSVVLPNFSRPAEAICMAPWLRPAISVQGYFTPCCTTFDPEHFGYIDLAERTFEQAWASPSVRHWIVGHMRDEHAICDGCGLNPRTFGVANPLGRSGKTGAERHVVAAT